jgi:ATP synthase regulation protein NCA2
MNALKAMDEVISANDINMNIAAITPVAILAYVSSKILTYLSHAVLKIRKSREETYASFRNVLTDMERLLVMRDNPPGGNQHEPNGSPSREKNCVLGPDDLGMIMLLIHECRTILWTDHRRFTPAMVQGITEDLAELAGERGEYSCVVVTKRERQTKRDLCVYSFGSFFVTLAFVANQSFLLPHISRGRLCSAAAPNNQQNDPHLSISQSDQYGTSVSLQPPPTRLDYRYRNHSFFTVSFEWIG